MTDKVTFGGVDATNYTVISPTKIIATAPPRVAGAVVVSVKNENGDATQTQNFTYTAPLELLPVTGALTSGVVGVIYNATTFSTAGGAPAYIFALSSGSTLPVGLSLNSSNGQITGTPTTAGQYSFTITVTDSVTASVSASYTMTMDELPIAEAVTKRSPPTVKTISFR